MEVYTTAFNSFDVDGSGKISFGEVGNLIRQVSDREPYESETQEVSSSLNKDLIWEKRSLRIVSIKMSLRSLCKANQLMDVHGIKSYEIFSWIRL